MGPGDDNYLKSLLDQKNKEIVHLNAQLLAHAARTSNVQTRLLQTLDILDQIQNRHALQLKDAEQRHTRLQQRLQHTMTAMVAAEADRDDLKESVLELVEKVEQSNDIRSWPFNRLQLTRFTEHPHPQGAQTQRLAEDDKLAYAGAIIERLRWERDDERVSHTLACEALQARIEALEAQLARREVELEYYATHTTSVPGPLSEITDGNTKYKTKGPTRSGSSTRYGREFEEQRGDRDPESHNTAIGPIPALTNEQITKMLDTTAARNRALEVEIKTLFMRLEQARSKPSASVTTSASKLPPRLSVASPSDPTGSGTIGDDSNKKNGDGRDSDDRSATSQQWRSRNAPRNRGPRTHVFTSHGSGQVAGEFDRENRRLERMPEEPYPSRSPGPLIQSRSTPLLDNVDDMDWGVPDSRQLGVAGITPQAYGVLDHQSPSIALAGLHGQIRELSTQIDAFREEREKVMKVVATQLQSSVSRVAHQSENTSGRVISNPADDGDNQDGNVEDEKSGPFDALEHHIRSVEDEKRGPFDALEHRIRSVEDDCLRLRHDFDECKLATQARESEVLDQVQALQKQVDELNLCCQSMRTSIPLSFPHSSQCNRDHEQQLQLPSLSALPDPELGSVEGYAEEEEDRRDVITQQGRVTGADLLQPQSPHQALPQGALLDVIDGEMSMELATPLLPTSLLVHHSYGERQDDSVSELFTEPSSFDSEPGSESGMDTGREAESPVGGDDDNDDDDGKLGALMIDPPRVPLPPSPPADASDDADEGGEGGHDGGAHGERERREEEGDKEEATMLVIPARGGVIGMSATPPAELVSPFSPGS